VEQGPGDVEHREGSGTGNGVQLRWRKKALKGCPRSGSGMKEGREAQGGERRQEVEKT